MLAGGWYSLQMKKLKLGCRQPDLHENASQKAVSAKQPKALVLGSDTTVAIDEELIGPQHARSKEMLRHLSGRAHDPHCSQNFATEVA